MKVATAYKKINITKNLNPINEDNESVELLPMFIIKQGKSLIKIEINYTNADDEYEIWIDHSNNDIHEKVMVGTFKTHATQNYRSIVELSILKALTDYIVEYNDYKYHRDLIDIDLRDIVRMQDYYRVSELFNTFCDMIYSYIHVVSGCKEMGAHNDFCEQHDIVNIIELSDDDYDNI